MAEVQEPDWSKVVLTTYDPEEVTTQEKLEYGARAETTFTGNLERCLSFMEYALIKKMQLS
mgnify:CR=1 FL=1